MKTKIMKSLALAAGIVTAAFAFAGDIYEIRPCDSSGAAVSYPVASLDSPLGSGEELFFLVRLNNQLSGASFVPWVLKHSGYNSEAVDLAVTPPGIAIYVSGEKRYATLVKCDNTTRTQFTDLVFKYTTKAGDFALPILLANASGPAGDSDVTAGTYQWNPDATMWSVVRYDDEAVSVDMSFGDPAVVVSAPESDGRLYDYALHTSGFYVQTVSFDSNYESEDKSVWRYVHEDSNITSNYTPTVVTLAGSEAARTLYVWSKDETVAYVNTATTTHMTLEDGTEADVHVATIEIPGGEPSPVSIDLWGAVGGEGRETELVLSAFPYYRYSNAQGRYLQDYKTVTVKCVEPMPATVMVVADKDTMTADSSSDLNSGATLSVYLTQPATTALEVTITPKLNGTATAEYAMLSTSAKTVKTVASLSPTATVTIPAGVSGSANAQKVYVFALKGGATIDFVPSYTSAEITTEPQASPIEIVAANPVIAAPTEGAEIGATAGVSREMEIEIEDTYADRLVTQADAAAGNGYTIEVKYNDSLGWQTLSGTYYIGPSGLLRDGSNKLPSITYPTSSANTSSGTFSTTFRITEPINSLRATVTVKATVAAPKTVTVTADGDEFDEGDTVTFTVKLSGVNDTGSALYAFLLAGPEDDATAAKFNAKGRKCVITSDMTEEDWARTSGLVINADTDSNTGKVTLLDGGDGTTYYFNVVLCTTSYYDPNAVVTGYNSTYQTLTVNNVEPTIDEVQMNGNSADENGYFEGSYPMNIEQSFQVVVTDPGNYDVTATLDDDKFKTKWTVSRVGGGMTAYNETIAGDPSLPENAFKYTFTASGTYKITTQIRDKDIASGKFSSSKSETYVVVVAQPQLKVVVPDEIEETATRTSIAVNLGGYYNATVPMVVMLKVQAPSGANAGILKLDANYKAVPAGYEDIVAADADYDADNCYFFSISDTTDHEIRIVEMDGTPLTLTSGFLLTAKVLNTGTSTDPTMTWSEYYLKSVSTPLYINNVAPVVTITDENTNAWKVAGGSAESYPIVWTIRSDVDNDWTGAWSSGEGPGIKVTVYGTENEQTVFYYTDKTSATYKFVPNFGSTQGEKTVTVTIEDKDGATETHTYLYLVQASKYIMTTSVKPSGGTMGLSVPYGQAAGAGAGHVYVGVGLEGFSKAENFSLTWNCSSLGEVGLYGWGYKVGAVDDGSLNDGRDAEVNYLGNATAGTDITAGWYEYPDTERDSFLYTFLVKSGSDGEVTMLDGTIWPERSDAVLNPYVTLPSEQADDGSYALTRVDAIFSKEWRPSDNCGDINQDGIPDRSLIDYDFGVTFDGSSDLNTDLSSYNNDGDYLPAGISGGNKIVPNTSDNWKTADKAFHAFYEIRGFGSGLNACYRNADGTFPARDFTEYEELAFAEYAAEQGAGDLDAFWQAQCAGNENLTPAQRTVSGFWTPEAPSDPTKEDTDNDDLPDGYEYWFWYGARVGYPDANGVWQGRMTGRRLNLDDIDVFEEITADEICEGFNPIVSGAADGNAASRGSLLTRDFDGDGLYDYEEFLIGTNPVDCDTDDDKLPDGWEVMWGIEPLDASNTSPNGNASNPDGDAMAFATYLTKYDLLGALYNPYTVAGATIVEIGGEEADVRSVYITSFYIPEYLVGDDVKEYFLANCGDSIQGAYVGNEYATRTLGGTKIPVERDLTQVTVSLDDVDPDSITVYRDPDLRLVHDQVYTFFGFDPRTAWGLPDIHGYFTRWCPVCNSGTTIPGEAGMPKNTKAFTNYDEFLLYKYRGGAGGETVLEKLMNGTTCPNVAFEAKTFGDSETAYTYANHGADTDGDGVPDGWELYVGNEPILGTGGSAPNGNINGTGDADGDSLGLAAEYAGTDSCNAYADIETIYNNHPGAASGWYNKFFPTDPANTDTDGDGVADAMEGSVWKDSFCTGNTETGATFTFKYGGVTDEKTADTTTICFRGGGMNPCSADTDLDGLPDGWEYQFPGIAITADCATYYAGNAELYTDEMKVADGMYAAATNVTHAFITGGMDATFTDAVTIPTFKDPATGTVRDFDYDHDGLENFQEYLVQSVRCWRYDDTETPLMGRAIIWTGDPATTVLSEAVPGAYEKADVLDGKEYVATLSSNETLWAAISDGNLLINGGEIMMPMLTLDPETDSVITNWIGTGVMRAGVVDEGYDNKALGYFAACDNLWDQVYQISPSTVYGDLKGRGYMRIPQSMTSYSLGAGPVRVEALGYVSTDPRMWDTDQDGMDDYWEVFHGLNPIFGGEYGYDIIMKQYGVIANANNPWVGGEFTAIEDPGLDAMRAPWRMGDPMVDADGDGLRNGDEAIYGNITSPSPTHTDPSPAWMTDSTSPMSYVTQYYGVLQGENDAGYLTSFPWMWTAAAGGGVADAAGTQYKFAFEENEGFDTDGEWRSDAHETVHAVQPATDLLNALDPDRRAAVWLDGESSALVTVIDPADKTLTSDMFRQFTVEFWIKPEKTGVEQTIVERGFEYPASSLVNSNDQWRANFRVTIGADGYLYGLFDNDEAIESGSNEAFSTQKLKAGLIETNVWTHIAMTYDGDAFVIYVNGVQSVKVTSSAIPANGVVAITQEPADSDKYPVYSYQHLPGTFLIGARRTGVGFDWYGDMTQFAEFFGGYVSELRVWDGARSATEIAGSYKTRFGEAEILENRELVYQKFASGASRNDSLTSSSGETLPAQIMAVYNFQQLPSAIDAGDVALTPGGFAAGVLANCLVDGETPEMANIWWWYNATNLRSTVYTDYHVLPRAQNAVIHVTPFDDGMIDSEFWSQNFAGYTPAYASGVSSYGIPNGGNPYFGVNGVRGNGYRSWRLLTKEAERSSTAASYAARFTFDQRSLFAGFGDLVPLGGAFAKRDSALWDGQGAATAWADTSTDSDADDLPDWWEEYAQANYGVDGDVTPTTIVTYHGLEMKASEAYMRDLAKGMLPTKEIDKTYVNREDTDSDGMPDWWAKLYEVEGAAGDDDDMDGLSNYTEYLLSEVFDLGQLFSPVNAYSVSAYDSDYFFKIGQLYAGEIFTDHDMMEDAWEKSLGTSYTSRYLWDAKKDNEEDGWSAFSECRYNEFVSGIQAKFISHMVNGGEVIDFPTPTVAATIRYNGTQRLSETDATSAASTNTVVPLVVKAYHDSLTQSKGALSDAQWTIYPGQTVARVQQLGIWSSRTVHGTLTPGNVDPNSVTLEFSSFLSNDYYLWAIYDEDASEMIGMMNGTYEEYLQYVEQYGSYGWTYYSATGFTPGRIELLTGSSDWDTFEDDWNISVTSDDSTENGYFCFLGKRIGTINLATGEYSLDLSAFEHVSLSNGSLTNTTQTTSIDNSLVRISYTAQAPTLQTQKTTVYLGQPDVGYVREGANDFIAFYDLDSNGEYNPGEPFGYIRNVGIGWYKRGFELELTDVSPVATRSNFWTSENDRTLTPADALTSGDDRFDVTTNLMHLTEAEIDDTSKYLHYRVARWTVDGYPRNVAGIPAREVASGIVNKADLTGFTEREILADGELDLDWANFSEISDSDAVDLMSLNVTNVSYLVVLSEEGASSFDRKDSTNEVVAYANVITRRFDATRAKAVPTDVSLTMINSQPSFSWKISGESAWASEFGSSYTAFKLRVKDSSGTVVYNSGNKRMPACDRNGVYTFEPPVYAGCELTPGEYYTWQVSIKNSKFQSDSWSDEATVLVNTLQNSDEFGSIDICVKYFGPASVLNDGNVYVEAFSSPDFTGSPVGRAKITTSARKAKVAATDTKHEAITTIIGLPAGTYYVRAYIDSKSYGTEKSRQAWESWGYVCPRQKAANEWMFSPTAIKVGDDQGTGDLFDVYIEDVDTNQNGLPDAWEMVNNGGSLDTTVETIDATLSGVVVNEELNGELTYAEGDGTEAAGLAAHALSAISNAGIAVLALDVDPSGKSSYSASLVGVSTETDAEGTPKITSITFVDGKLTITADVAAEVSTTTSSGSSSSASTIWTTSGSSASATVTARVLYKASLSDANWLDTGVSVELTVTEDGTVSTGDIDLTEFLESKGNPEKLFFIISVD